VERSEKGEGNDVEVWDEKHVETSGKEKHAVALGNPMRDVGMIVGSVSWGFLVELKGR
jgi:hypothetical protein